MHVQNSWFVMFCFRFFFFVPFLYCKCAGILDGYELWIHSYLVYHVHVSQPSTGVAISILELFCAAKVRVWSMRTRTPQERVEVMNMCSRPRFIPIYIGCFHVHSMVCCNFFGIRVYQYFHQIWILLHFPRMGHELSSNVNWSYGISV